MRLNKGNKNQSELSFLSQENEGDVLGSKFYNFSPYN